MANILLLPTSVAQSLTLVATPISGNRQSSQIINLAADDTTAHADEIQITIEANGSATGEAVNVYVAEGTHAGPDDFDGPVPESGSPTVDQIKNINLPSSLIMGPTVLMRTSMVFRVNKPRFIVVVHNATAVALTALVATVQIYNYEST